LTIDARQFTSKELFIKLKDILASQRGCDVSIEILTDTGEMSRKIKAFISMTGCHTESEKKEGYYIIRITGSPCCI
jgi:TusA-related sulfurtransferase